MRRRYNCLATIISGLLFAAFYIVIRRENIDSCHARDCVRKICHEYENNRISGTLCEKLCHKETNWVSCHKSERNLQAFINSDYYLVVCNNLWLPNKPNTLKPIFGLNNSKNFNQFIDKLSSMLSKLYGIGDYSNVLEKILPRLDINNDKIFSYDEVATIVSLLRSKDFVYRLLFWDSPYFPQIIGVCGNAYALAYPPYKISLIPSTASSFKRIKNLKWEVRMVLATNLLSLFSKAFRQNLGPSPLMYCHAPQTQIGFTAQFDAQILFPTDVVIYRSNQSCAQPNCSGNMPPNDDCAKRCDKRAGYDNFQKCLTRVGVQSLCKLLEDGLYLSEGPDSEVLVLSRLRHFFDQCRDGSSGLGEHSSINLNKTEVDFSLLLHNIFSTIWDAIHLYNFDEAKVTSDLTPFHMPYADKEDEKELNKRIKDGFSYL